MCFTMSLKLLMKIRETTKVHDVAAFIRRALASEVKTIQSTDFESLRSGNMCSLVVRATRDIVEMVADRSTQQLASMSCLIESCCWSFIDKQQ